VIRVFSVPDGACRYQFRRGSFTATISSLSFNQGSDFLTVCSNSETVHIFKLDTAVLGTPLLDNPAEALVSDKERKAARGMAAQFIPTAITDLLEPQRDFAHLRLPDCNIPHIATLHASIPQVMVATTAGYFYLYAIDLLHGGECTLVKQFSLNSYSD
jgi:autophagy-related protein 18